LNESQEEAILQLWEETDAFHQQLKLSEGRPEYVTSLFSRILWFLRIVSSFTMDHLLLRVSLIMATY